MPKTTDWEDIQRLQYVLQHEYVHIRRFDMIRKLAAALVLCIHWFNPAVWIMYLIYNRDIELSCDESVVREFGESSKPLYAKALIAMEEKRNSLQPLSNSFSKNAIEERIKAVMKTKKVTVWATIISVAVISIIILVFATSANTAERDEQVSANLAGENIFSFSGDQYFPLIIDDDIVLNDLFIQFIEGDANAYSYGEEKNISDYYEEYSVRGINVVHFMAEDLNGDGEDELLININWTYYEGIILAFHCQDGDLFEWESISYGMHSPEVTLYPDVNIVEVTGTGWTRSFYTYNSQGEKMQIFSCSSIEDNLEDGSFRRQYLITVYQDGIAKEEYSVEEIFDENDNVVFVSSEEETLIFHGVLDDFLNMLGEGKQISSTQNDVEVTDTVISGNANSTNNTDDYVPDDEWEAVTAVTGEDVIAFFDTITEDMLDACDEYPSVESYWTDPIVLLDSGRLYGIRANGQEAMLIYRDGEKILIEHPFGNLYQERPNLHIGNIDNDAMYEMTISFRTITGNIKRYGMIVCDYTNNTWNVYEYDDYLKDIEEAIQWQYDEQENSILFMNNEGIILTENKLPEWSEGYPFAGNVNFNNWFSFNADLMKLQVEPQIEMERSLPYMPIEIVFQVNFDNGDFSLGSYYIQDAQNGSHDPETTVEPIGTEYTGKIDGISLSEYIEKYVTLTDDTEIERWEMLNHNGENILRIRVGYNQDDLRGTIEGHKEDYFIFLNGNGEAGYILHVGYEDKTLGYVCDYSAHFEDVTFDGNDDLLIYLGDGRYSPHYCAFIYENGQYRYEKSFEDIPYYELDMENQVIRAYDGMSATEEADYIFEYKNGEFVLTEENIHSRVE